MSDLKRHGTVRIVDSRLHVQENICPPLFSEYLPKREGFAEVFDAIVRFLRRRGWRVRLPARDNRDNRIRFSKRVLQDRQSCLLGEIHWAGAHIDIKFWQNGINGGRHVFSKLKRMPYLVRLRCLATLNKLSAHLIERYSYRPDHALPECGLSGQGFRRLPAEAWIPVKLQESGHYKADLGRAEFSNGDSSRKSADGEVIEHGQTCWVQHGGRFFRGVAFYDLGDTWRVQFSRYHCEISWCWKIYVRQPPNLKGRQFSKRYKTLRLRTLMKNAAERENYQWALALQEVLRRKEAA